MASIVHRRTTTTSARLRENHTSLAGSSSSGKAQKANAGDGARDDSPLVSEPTVLRKRKSSSTAAASSSQSGSLRLQRPLSGLPEAVAEQTRKAAARPASRSSDAEVQAMLDPRAARKHGKSKRRDRSASRDPSARPAARVAHQHAGEDVAGNHGHSRGHDELHKLKEELDAAKKQLSSYKKTMGKQNKTIDDLKKELTTARQSHQDERKQVEKLQTKSKKNDEVISTIEANMNCQICMDMLMKPYGLSPCGHVLCLTCLQEWFRAAPAGEDDMYDDDPDSLVYRKKTCPVCRTAVLSRPIPLFLVKSIAAALTKARDAGGAASPPASPAPEGDPWEGIFPDPADQMWVEDDEYHDAYSDEALTEPPDIYHDVLGSDGEEDWPFDGYGSDSDDEPYEGLYVPARWEEPRVDVDPEDCPFDLSEEALAMLRRGATTPMIALFDMSYSDYEGLRAVVNGNVVFLGWNIERHPADEAGEEFMEWVEADVYNHPERWDREDAFDGGWTAWRLVREDEVEDYASDSDVYYGEGDYDAYPLYNDLD